MPRADQLRSTKLLVVLSVVIALAAGLTARAAPARHQTAGRTSVRTLDAGVLTRINEIRAAHGLVPLTPNPALAAAAARHSIEMVTDGYFAHQSRSGSPFWDRLANYVGSARRSWSVGENLLWSSPRVGPAKALELWMASPEHRQNILRA